jgi:hypothetical protein
MGILDIICYIMGDSSDFRGDAVTVEIIVT